MSASLYCKAYLCDYLDIYSTKFSHLAYIKNICLEMSYSEKSILYHIPMAKHILTSKDNKVFISLNFSRLYRLSKMPVNMNGNNGLVNESPDGRRVQK